MNKITKLGIELGLFVVILLLAYLVYNSVNENIEFEDEKNRMTELVKTKLEDARELQFAYESKYGKYAKTWNELLQFATQDSLEFERRIGDMEDSVAVAEGLAYVEQVKIPVIQKLSMDSVFSKTFDIKTLNLVPESDSLFVIDAGTVSIGGSSLPTFQISVTWDVLLDGLDAQLIQNSKESSNTKTGFEGIRVGKIDEASTEGNWE